MDVTTFYALFSATCFTLLGLWWNVVQAHPAWARDEVQRRAVGGVYLSFLLPALMGLFAQVGGTETPVIWRVSFVAVAVIGLVSTVRLLNALRGTARRSGKHLAAAVLYVLIAVVGVAPELGRTVGLAPIQAEALLLIGLVVVGHGLVWEFLVTRVAPHGEPVGDEV